MDMVVSRPRDLATNSGRRSQAGWPASSLPPPNFPPSKLTSSNSNTRKRATATATAHECILLYQDAVLAPFGSLARSRFSGWPAPSLLAGPSLAGWLHCWLAPLYRWTVPLSLAGLPLLLAGLSLLHLCYPGWTSNPTLTDTQAGPTLAPSLTYSLSLGFTLLYSFAPQLSLLSNRGNSPSSSTLCLLALIVWHNKAAYLCRISTYVLLMFQY